MDPNAVPPSSQPAAVGFWQEATAAAQRHGGVAAYRRRRRRAGTPAAGAVHTVVEHACIMHYACAAPLQEALAMGGASRLEHYVHFCPT